MPQGSLYEFTTAIITTKLGARAVLIPSGGEFFFLFGAFPQRTTCGRTKAANKVTNRGYGILGTYVVADHHQWELRRP